MSRPYDALIIGGGPAGATAALLLARAGWSVAVLERKEFPRRKVCGEYLSATNLPLFDRLGIGASFRDLAGPPVRRVGLFAGSSELSTELARPAGKQREWGRALSRQRLDALLLAEAGRAGAEVRQPRAVTALWREGEVTVCQAKAPEGGRVEHLSARVAVAAHGSWDAGALPTQPARQPPAPGDLLGFKAHFTGADLPVGLMPLLAFPGGYGGMVHGDDGQVSVSCCVRRDQLARLRGGSAGDAGDVVQAHLEESCFGVRRALRGARRSGAWLAAGPIRPGLRVAAGDRVFRVGNAAGEAHPVVAEGISMAMQASWLLCRRLVAWRAAGAGEAGRSAVARSYAGAWRGAFAGRLHVAELLAGWAMRPLAVRGLVPVVRCYPPCLDWFARLSGKAKRVVRG